MGAAKKKGEKGEFGCDCIETLIYCTNIAFIIDFD